MPKIASVEDLRKLREVAFEKIAARLQGEEIDNLVQVYVGMDDSGIEAGAKEVYNHLWNLALGKKIVVLQTAKIGELKEPAVKVVLPGKSEAAAFEEVNVDKANQIITEYVEKGTAVDGMVAIAHE